MLRFIVFMLILIVSLFFATLAIMNTMPFYNNLQINSKIDLLGR